ncbi:MAG: GNAT family N-acetyltransferase [Lachnospiraceae bacterium]|nr:GNAT family N-acetyltransferase [Lachnospiraceae bacterium]
MIKLNKKVPTIKTQRLILRGITEDDADFIVKLRINPDIYKYFLHPHAISRDEHIEWYKSIYLKDDTRLNWVVLLEDNPIGIFGLSGVKNKCGEAELGYILSNEYYGNGYASEALEAIKNWSKENWKCETLIAEIHKENELSIKFVLKNGFILEKENGKFSIYRIKI